MDTTNPGTINPVAQQAVDQSANQSNSNGIPGSLPGETRAETQARLYKVMVDGQEMEVDENELRRGYAHNKAAAKRMEEAAMTRKEAEEVLRMIKENPKTAFQRLGLDPRQFAENLINEELQEAMLDPREKELREYKRQLEQYQNAEKAQREQYEREQLEKMFQQQTEALQADVQNVLQTSGLPITAQTVARISYYMESAINAGYSNITAKDVVEFVKKDYVNDFKALLGGLSEDQIEMFLGTDVVRKVAKSTVKQAKVAPTTPKSVNQNIKQPQKQIKSPRDFFKDI